MREIPKRVRKDLKNIRWHDTEKKRAPRPILGENETKQAIQRQLPQRSRIETQRQIEGDQRQNMQIRRGLDRKQTLQRKPFQIGEKYRERNQILWGRLRVQKDPSQRIRQNWRKF